MGHTQYFSTNWSNPERLAVWPQLAQDARLIIEAADIDLTGNWDDRAEPIPPIVNLDEICFNGIAENEHEPFIMGPNPVNQAGDGPYKAWGIVKTNLKPYNLPVTTILLRAHYLTGCSVGSDGQWGDDEWKDARELYKVLWPDELVYCPWTETTKAGVKISGYETELLNAPTPVAPPLSSGEDTVEEKLRQLQLDSESLSKLTGPHKSTVSGINLNHAREWLDGCGNDQTGHSGCQEAPTGWDAFPGVTFRVIDVQKRCIVDAPEDCSFVILTYVWGGVDQPKLLEETSPLLMQDGGLTTIWPKIPTTVRDAIEVCAMIGERYLWVDAICMRQDSARDMRIQILRMKRIYSSAKCTIVAASAATAEVGLLGTPGDASTTPCTSEDALDVLLETTPWNTRAWCYQERVLSHRAIIFTSNGIYAKCQQHTYNAETGYLLAPRSQHTHTKAQYNAIGGMLSTPTGQDLKSYLSAMEYYSARQLTNSSDKLSAFQAIFQRYRGSLDGRSSGFHYGMPVDGFDQLICFRTALHTPHLRNTSFPSWSWLGWNDPVVFDRKLISTVRTRQMLQPDNLGWMVDSGEADRSSVLRKRAMIARGKYQLGVGFPSAENPFRYEKEIYFVASSLHLSIDAQPVDTKGSNGLYAVRTAYCSYMPMIGYLDPEEPVVVPFVPRVTRGNIQRSSGDVYDLAVHEGHAEDCEAKKVLGHIWLDRQWREKEQPKDCVLRFLAMAGERRGRTREPDCFDRTPEEEEEENKKVLTDYDRKWWRDIFQMTMGEWNITTLMCVQPAVYRGQADGADERVQVMDCCIPDEEWLRLGSYTFFHRLV